MEELTEGRYFKTPDAIEKYLIQMVEDYFNRTNYTAPGSRENIINECLKRLKDEVDFDNVGVLSITLPGDKDPRTGNVNITLDELGGEPKISPKYSAFNVNFGTTANTACEGDDPRLSDARRPLPHIHDIAEINGLSIELSNINNRITNISSYAHSHSNKELLERLIYSGDDQTSDIDLSILGGFNGTIYQQLIDDLRAYILDCKTEMNDRMIEYETNTVTWVNNRYTELVQKLSDSMTAYQSDLYDYVENYFNNLRIEINDLLKDCVLRDEFDKLSEMAKDKCIVAEVTTVTIAELFDQHWVSSTMDELDDIRVNVERDVPANAIQVFTDNKTLNNYTVEAYLVYADGRETELPYMYFTDDAVGSLIVTSDIANKKINFIISGRTMKIPGELGSASVKIVYVCKEDRS